MLGFGRQTRELYIRYYAHAQFLPCMAACLPFFCIFTYIPEVVELTYRTDAYWANYWNKCTFGVTWHSPLHVLKPIVGCGHAAE